MVVGEMSDIASTKKSRFARLFIMTLLLSLFGFGVWTGWLYLLQPPPEDSLVVLRADPTPFRVKPAAGTIADIPNQDSTFMNLIDGSSEVEKNSEVITLTDPAPEPPPVTVSKPKGETAQIVGKNNPDTNAQTQQLTERSETADKKVSDKVSATVSGQPGSGDMQERIISPEAEQKKPGAVDLTVAQKAPAMPTPRPKPTKSGQGELMVQLAAFRKEDKAKTAAALLNQKHADRLQGYLLNVRSVNSIDGQLFWRVITNPLPKQAALSICDGLKRAGQDCIIRQTKAQKP